ncbi:hypothetical protein [Crassaminicella profunda]|uniref:hypothetical protein n=1 Tax=Crassaminicella profunda TaxID=1286698 RepID=UPI001CA7AC70|nr:hypothetical protein [Crassaminicella profunda]QZY54438.1 hypothetical protein K7H06_15540 [Crassaminicella profunda]
MMKEEGSSQLCVEAHWYIRKIESRLKDVVHNNLLEERDLETIKEIYNKVNDIFKRQVEILDDQESNKLSCFSIQDEKIISERIDALEEYYDHYVF